MDGCCYCGERFSPRLSLSAHAASLPPSQQLQSSNSISHPHPVKTQKLDSLSLTPSKEISSSRRSRN
ncbi:hypothetical protein ACFX15_033436 [Malus domestica]